MNSIFKENTPGYKVLTPSGFQSFSGVSLMNIAPTVKLTFEQNAWIECTLDHKLYISDTEYKTADQLNIGDTVITTIGDLRLLHKVPTGKTEPVYDLIEVANGHKYFTNKILSSNCEFLIYDETLINSITLAGIEGIQPIMNMGQTRWYKKPNKNSVYAIALDPSLGTGGNSAGIEVFELPSFEQVAEWHHNLTPIQGQIRVLREILKYLVDVIGEENSGNIYWSLENNTVGEAGLICIKNIGEENFPGLLVSEPIRKGHVRKFRKGYNTTHKTKISAAARLKHLIETGKMKIYSKPLISELKAYIANGVTFKAKSGEEDDLVSALLLIVRMSETLADWDPRVFEQLSAAHTDEDFEFPMPIFVSSS
jgi:hypothetical protein